MEEEAIHSQRHSAFNPRPTPAPEVAPKPLKFPNSGIIEALRNLDLGSGIAEDDVLLSEARIETSAFSDLINDRVDIIPGTKGSGKSALYRIFVDFIFNFMYDARKTVIAHGITRQGDELFNAYKESFDKFDEDDFQNFWSVYLISLANTQFVELPRFQRQLAAHDDSVAEFQKCCDKCAIPRINSRNFLLETFQQSILWVGRFIKPKATYQMPNDAGSIELELGMSQEVTKRALPIYLASVKDCLHNLLEKCGLKIWFMIDRLDEIFPPRSKTEKLAMRGLLRTVKLFRSERIRVKLFIRDDMLSTVVGGNKGFVALSHLIDRKADMLCWSEEQLLSMIVKRACSSVKIRQLVGAEKKLVDEDMDYRRDVFYRIFPPIADGRKKGSPTMKWIYTHLSDGRGVVTPRDVIQLVTVAKQKQQSLCQESPNGISEFVISSKALKHALIEVSKVKRDAYLKAEFPHIYPKVEKLIGGKTELSQMALAKLYGEGWEAVVDDFVSLGILRVERKRDGERWWKVPFIYRAGLEMKQGQSNGDMGGSGE